MTHTLDPTNSQGLQRTTNTPAKKAKWHLGVHLFFLSSLSLLVCLSVYVSACLCLSLYGPDMTFAVDRALKTNYLWVCLSVCGCHGHP